MRSTALANRMKELVCLKEDEKTVRIISATVAIPDPVPQRLVSIHIPHYHPAPESMDTILRWLQASIDLGL